MKTLITGATGHVGANLVRALLEQKRDVRVLIHQRDTSLEGLDVERVHGDVLNPNSLTAAFEGVDFVHHLVAKINIDGTQHDAMLRTNVEGTQNVVDACLHAGVRRLIHFSSIHALSYMPKSESIDESRALAITEEHLAYDRSKALAEEVVLAAVQQGLDAVILNPVGIIGPFDFEPSPMGELLLQLAHREMPGLVKAGFFWVDVRDVATASIAAEQRGRTGERYILHGEYGLVTSLAKQVQDVTGRRPPLFTAPLWLARLVAPGA